MLFLQSAFNLSDNSLQIRLLLKQTKKRFMERFFPNSSSQNHIPMKKLSRKHSETYVTQVGFSTTGSRLGSRFFGHVRLRDSRQKLSELIFRYSLDTDSPSPRGGSTNNLGPSFKTGAKTTLEVRKSNVSFHSVDSVWIKNHDGDGKKNTLKHSSYVYVLLFSVYTQCIKSSLPFVHVCTMSVNTSWKEAVRFHKSKPLFCT